MSKNKKKSILKMKHATLIEFGARAHTKKMFSIFLFVFISNTITAQKLIAKFSPFSLLDPATPTLLMGAEIITNRHWAFELDYGIKTNTGVFHWNLDKSHHHYFKLRLDAKYYFRFRKNKAYGGISFFEVPQSYNSTNGTYFVRSGYYSYDKAHVTKNIYGLCLKLGYVRKLSERFSFEVFAGVGARFVDMEFTNIEGKKKTVMGFTEWLRMYDTAGWQRLVHVESGVKINYTVLKWNKASSSQ